MALLRRHGRGAAEQSRVHSAMVGLARLIGSVW